MKFIPKEVGGVYEIETEPHIDERGYFVRTYDKKIFKQYGLDRVWVQENHSFSKYKGTIRGFHFQYPPNCETKLLRIIKGKILFTVVDLRKESRTFGKWTQVVLSDKKKNMLYIPRGCAPCMCTLINNCHIAYKVDNYYAPDNEDNIKWNDPDLAVIWPLKAPAVISERDKRAQSFRKFVKNHGGIEIK